MVEQNEKLFTTECAEYTEERMEMMDLAKSLRKNGKMKLFVDTMSTSLKERFSYFASFKTRILMASSTKLFKDVFNSIAFNAACW